MQRSKFTLVSSFTVGLVAFVLVGCGASSTETTDPTSDSASETASTETNEEDNSAGDASGQGQAVFTYGDAVYSSELQFCALTDSQDALFHGLAYDESGNEIGYLGGDFGMLDGDAFGEVRIDFGATEQFASSDEFIAMGDAASDIVLTSSSDTEWHVVGGAWDQNGAVTPSSSLHVTC